MTTSFLKVNRFHWHHFYHAYHADAAFSRKFLLRQQTFITVVCTDVASIITH